MQRGKNQTSTLLCITIYNNNDTNQITDIISTLQFIPKLHNFMHITSMQSNTTSFRRRLKTVLFNRGFAEYM